MPILFLAANGRYIKNESNWASTLHIFKHLQAEIQGSAYEIRLPADKALQDFLDYVHSDEFTGFRAEGYGINFIHDWDSYVQNYSDEDAAVMKAEAEELKRRLNEEGWTAPT